MPNKDQPQLTKAELRELSEKGTAAFTGRVRKMPTYERKKCPDCRYEVRRLQLSKKTFPCFQCGTVF